MGLSLALGGRRAGSIGQFNEIGRRAPDPGTVEGVVVAGLGVIGDHIVRLESEAAQTEDHRTEGLSVLEVAVTDLQSLLRTAEHVVDDGDGVQAEVVGSGNLQGDDLVRVGADVFARLEDVHLGRQVGKGTDRMACRVGEGRPSPRVGNDHGIFGIGGDAQLALPEVGLSGFQSDHQAVGQPQLGHSQWNVACQFEEHPSPPQGVDGR